MSPVVPSDVARYPYRLPRHFGRRTADAGTSPHPAATLARLDQGTQPIMLDQLDPSTEKFTSPTGLKVRADLYDEDYSDED